MHCLSKILGSVILIKFCFVLSVCRKDLRQRMGVKKREKYRWCHELEKTWIILSEKRIRISNLCDWNRMNDNPLPILNTNIWKLYLIEDIQKWRHTYFNGYLTPSPNVTIIWKTAFIMSYHIVTLLPRVWNNLWAASSYVSHLRSAII